MRTHFSMQVPAGTERPRLTISASVPSRHRCGAVVVTSGVSVMSLSRQRCCGLARSAIRQPFLSHLVQTFRQTALQCPCSTAGDSSGINPVSPTVPSGSPRPVPDDAFTLSVRNSSTTPAATHGNELTHQAHNAHMHAVDSNPMVYSTSLPIGNGNSTGPSELRSASISKINAVDLPVISPTISTFASPPTPTKAAPYTLFRALHALYLFSRPHTMLGTTLSVISISLLALGAAPPSPLLVNTAGIALVQVCMKKRHHTVLSLTFPRLMCAAEPVPYQLIFIDTTFWHSLARRDHAQASSTLCFFYCTM